MSHHHENVIWQSPNGTWNRGFYERIRPAFTDEDYDSEWDDDFDFERFEWASTGLASEQAAVDSWPGPNPGGWTVYADPTPQELSGFESALLWLRDPKAALKEARKAWLDECAQRIREADPKPGQRVRVVYSAHEEQIGFGGTVYTGHLVTNDRGQLVISGTDVVLLKADGEPSRSGVQSVEQVTLRPVWR